MDNAFIRRLSASQISVGWSSLVQNGGFEQGLSGWLTTMPIKVGPVVGDTGAAACYIAANASYSGNTWVTNNDLRFDCAPDDKFHLSFRATYTGAAPPSNSYVQIYISFDDSAGNPLYSGVVARVNKADVDAVGGGANWATARAITHVPAGAVRGRVSVQVYNHTTPGSFWNWDDVVCTRATTGVLIDEDAIEAPHVKARVLTADKLVLGGITYNEVGLNQMTVPVFAYTSGEATVAASASATIQSLNITTIGRPVQVIFAVEMRKDGSTLAPVDFAIKRGSTTLVSYTLDVYGGYFARTIAYVDTAPGSGSQTYSVVVTGPGVESYYRRRMLSISEVRR